MVSGLPESFCEVASHSALCDLADASWASRRRAAAFALRFVDGDGPKAVALLMDYAAAALHGHERTPVAIVELPVR